MEAVKTLAFDFFHALSYFTAKELSQQTRRWRSLRATYVHGRAAYTKTSWGQSESRLLLESDKAGAALWCDGEEIKSRFPSASV